MSSEATNFAGTAFENQIDLEKLHLNFQWSDVKFLFNSGNGTTCESIPANKAVLAAQSDVFAAMFYGELKEKGDITVTDASVDGFKEFLQFFHLNRVQLTVENVAEVMDLGHKYNVPKCVVVCAQFLMGAVTVENACIGLSLAILYDRQDLKERCEKFIGSNSEAVLKSMSFLECDKPVVAHVLRMESLICTETIVFEACMEWIKAKSKQNEVTKQLIQEHLGELFYDFRFTSMAMKEFDDLSIAHEYAFSTAEYKDIMRTFASLIKTSKLFNNHARQRLWEEGAIIICNRKIADLNKAPWWYLHDDKQTQFELTKPMLLGTLVFAPLYFVGNSKFNDTESGFLIDVTIIESLNVIESTNKSTRAISNFEISLPLQKETSIDIPTPVYVKPGFYYEIRLNLQKPRHNIVYDCGGVAAEVQIGKDVVIGFYGDRKTDRNKLLNVITGLGFNKI